mmetsp:Transcript_5794/g.14732  ORF Transcript_5794/g.14732 Transcript_5794/m.14732 type:complete len:205 (-) Transcript_5794:145-759(-)
MARVHSWSSSIGPGHDVAGLVSSKKSAQKMQNLWVVRRYVSASINCCFACSNVCGCGLHGAARLCTLSSAVPLVGKSGTSRRAIAAGLPSAFPSSSAVVASSSSSSASRQNAGRSRLFFSAKCRDVFTAILYWPSMRRTANASLRVSRNVSATHCFCAATSAASSASLARSSAAFPIPFLSVLMSSSNGFTGPLLPAPKPVPST